VPHNFPFPCVGASRCSRSRHRKEPFKTKCRFGQAFIPHHLMYMALVGIETSSYRPFTSREKSTVRAIYIANHGSKNHYAVVHGACSPAPGIFSSWSNCLDESPPKFFRGVAEALTTGVKHAVFKRFQTIEAAKIYMSANGLTDYCIMDKQFSLEERSHQRNY
jgi:Caulimovirus viroplasmin